MYWQILGYVLISVLVFKKMRVKQFIVIDSFSSFKGCCPGTAWNNQNKNVSVSRFLYIIIIILVPNLSYIDFNILHIYFSIYLFIQFVCKVSQGKTVHHHVLILRTETNVRICVIVAKICVMHPQGVKFLPQICLIYSIKNNKLCSKHFL